MFSQTVPKHFQLRPQIWRPWPLLDPKSDMYFMSRPSEAYVCFPQFTGYYVSYVSVYVGMLLLYEKFNLLVEYLFFGLNAQK